MDINIRKSIIDNFKGSSVNDINEAIEESLKDKEEVTLPGMGVFFEILWSNSNKKDKEKIINIIKNSID